MATIVIKIKDGKDGTVTVAAAFTPARKAGRTSTGAQCAAEVALAAIAEHGRAMDPDIEVSVN